MFSSLHCLHAELGTNYFLFPVSQLCTINVVQNYNKFNLNDAFVRSEETVWQPTKDFMHFNPIPCYIKQTRTLPALLVMKAKTKTSQIVKAEFHKQQRAVHNAYNNFVKLVQKKNPK